MEFFIGDCVVLVFFDVIYEVVYVNKGGFVIGVNYFLVNLMELYLGFS